MGIMRGRYIAINRYNLKVKMLDATLVIKTVEGVSASLYGAEWPTVRFTVELYANKVCSLKPPVLNCFLLWRKYCVFHCIYI